MNRILILAAFALGLGLAGGPATVAFSPLQAQTAATQKTTAQATTFAVENMYCALCPVTVKTAMERVAGVRSVRVDFDKKTAAVVFDPSVTTVEAIAAASTKAGYPAAPAS